MPIRPLLDFGLSTLKERIRELVEERVRTLLDAAPDGMLIVNSAGVIVLANQVACAMFGYSEAELWQLGVDALVPESLREQHVAQRRGYVDLPYKRDMGVGRPMVGRRRDGSQFPAEISLSPLPVDDGTMTLAVVRDISARILVEQEHTARHDAEAAVRMRDEFLAVAAHELKTPLTSLQGYTQLLDTQLCDPEPDRRAVQRSLRAVLDQTQRLTRLSAQLLDVSRITAGRVMLRPELVDLAVLVRETVNRARSRAEALQLSVQAPRSLKARLDAGRIEQVLTNLLENSAKYADGRVDLELLDQGDRALLSVRDYGPGIAADQAERIFERAYQVDASNAGLGLGLYISRQLIELHSGRIWVENAQPGARFVIDLPRG